MNSSYIITFIGNDRPGLVESVANAVKHHDGNWQESRLSQLGGKFAGLILVSLPESRVSDLERDLRSLDEGSLDATITPTGEEPAPPPGRTITLTVIGPDRKGIVQEISRALASQQINVIEMDSRVVSAPMSAEMIFEARIGAWILESTDMDRLRDALEAIADQMTLEIELDQE